MIYSFIGLGKPIAAVNNILKTHIRQYHREHPFEEPLLEAGGIYASDLSMAASFAGDNDMCAYMSIDELLKKSDIIFLFLSDRALKNISVTLGKYLIKNKIFCHFSGAFSADIMDFNSNNTYVSMFLPSFCKDEDGRTVSNHIIAEGYGKQLTNLKGIFELFDIGMSLITKEEKLMYLTGINLVKDMPSVIKATAKRLVKYSLASDAELAEEISELIEQTPSELNSYNAMEFLNEDFVLKQCQTIKSLGIPDITNLFSSLGKLYLGQNPSSESAQKIHNILDKSL